MRTGSAFGVFALVVALAVDSAAAPSVVEAKRALEGARSKLASAVARIEKDPPSTVDLDAAHAAVVALKAAIDAGAELEPKDLDYARAALAARKELRTRREYVDDRRAKVHIHESRRAIDGALSSLKEAKGIDASKEAASKLEKALEAGRAWAGQDAKYASYVAEVKAELDRERKAIDALATAKAVGEQRSAVEERQRALTAALAALGGKDVGDAAFEAADRALTGLSQALEAKRPLEAQDKAYGAQAVSARAEVQKARKRIDEEWSKTGLSRLKGEIDPARSDLVEAGRSLRSSPTTEQIAEARTAAIVVRKLIEKFQPQAARSRAFEQYVAEVRKSLIVVEVDLSKRSVEPARDVVERLSRSAADESALEATERSIAEARTILGRSAHLEKEDRPYAAYALDVKKRLDSAEAKVRALRAEVEVRGQRAALESAGRELAGALGNLKRRAPTEEHFAEARTAVTVLDKTIEATTAKDQALSKRKADLRTLVRAARSTIEERRLEVDLDGQRARVEEGRRELSSRMSKVFERSAGEEQIVSAEQAIVQVRAALADGTELAKRDSAYRSYEREVRKRLDETEAKIVRRRDEIAISAQRSTVEPALKALSQTVGAIDRLGPTPSEIVAAEAAAKAAYAALAEGEGLEQNVPAYAAWAKPARKAVEQAKARIAKGKVELAVAGGKSQLDEKVARVKSSLALAKQPEATDEHVGLAAESVKGLRDAIELGGALEKEDRRFATQLDEAREDIERYDAEVAFARQARALRKATLGGLAAGAAADEAAASAKDLRAQRRGYEKAVAELKSCQSAGESLLDENKALAGIAVIVDGSKSGPKDVIALCVERADAVRGRLSKVVGLIEFEEGPSQSYESGKALIGRAAAADEAKKKDLIREALAAFQECISSGKILQHRNPELRDRKLDVMGGQMTLNELVTRCTAETDQIQKKAG